MNESRGFFFCFFLSRPSKEFLVRMFGSLSYQSAFFPIFGAGPTSALAPLHCKSEGGGWRGGISAQGQRLAFSESISSLINSLRASQTLQ